MAIRDSITGRLWSSRESDGWLRVLTERLRPHPQDSVEVTIWSHFRDQRWTGWVEFGFDPLADEDRTNEELFRLFNRVEEADAVRLTAWGYNLPSLSVGDRVTYGGQTFEVMPVGFQEVGR